MNRRDFLKLLGLAGGAAVVGAGREQHDGDEIEPHEWTPPDDGFDTVTVHQPAHILASGVMYETPAEYMRRKGELFLVQHSADKWEWVIDPE